MDYEFFQHFGSRAEERNGSVGGALVFWFAGFKQRQDYSMLPYCREIGVLIGEIEKCCKIPNAMWSEVL